MSWLRRKIRAIAFELLRRTEVPPMKIGPLVHWPVASSPKVADTPPTPSATERFEDVSEAARSWLAVHEITDECMKTLVHKRVSETEVLQLREQLTRKVADDPRCVWAGHKFADHCRLGFWMQSHQLNAVWYPASNLGYRWLRIGAAQDVQRKQEVLRS